ncbi:hypothetical protein L596_002780 [Steinernema carpocapsae]|uniref:C2 domain-containing protein n=1 Tax=Steinernema carpocapsae TaxID=34508 RepID=A0A4U8UQ84_STECR|nr:hypothetical protein L596_002780 [Steinernema carpocapsae]
MENELEMVREENRLLRETNDKLVANALEGEGLHSVDEEEMKEMRLRIHEMETQLMDAENELRSMNSRNRELDREKQKLLKRNMRLKQHVDLIVGEKMALAHRKISEDAEQAIEREATPVKRRSMSDVLEPLDKLFEDIALMLETKVASDSGSSDDKSELSSTTYQKMYQELYEELEKVRNMLLIQHKINQQQNDEIILLNAATEGNKDEYERKLGLLIEELRKRKQRIVILENQLKSIAYGGDLRSLKAESTGDISLTEDRPNEIELHFSKLVVHSENTAVFSSLRPQFFLSIEFFDFELETTTVFAGPDTILDFTTIYDVIVSNLFLHYVETDGITVELYEAKSNTYHLCGSGLIALKSLVSLKADSLINGELPLISADKQSVVGVLTYSIALKEELLKALKAHKKQSIAKTLIVEEDGAAIGSTNELIVTIRSGSDFNNLIKNKKPPSSYVAYSLFDQQPVCSKTVERNANPDFSWTQTFKVPQTDALHKYLKATEFVITIVQSDSIDSLSLTPGTADVIGRVSVPLFMLARNKPIIGKFSLTDNKGEMTPASIDIALRWRFDYKMVKKNTLPDIPIATPSSASKTNEKAIAELEKEFDEQKKKVRITIESDTSSDDDENFVVPPPATGYFDEKSPKQCSFQSVESEESSSSTVISAALSKKGSLPSPMNRTQFSDEENFLPGHMRVVSNSRVEETLDVWEQDEQKIEEEIEVISAASQPKSGQSPVPQQNTADESENDTTENVESGLEEDVRLPTIMAAPRTLLRDLPPLNEAPPVPAPRTHKGVEFTDPIHRSIPPSENSSVSESDEPRKKRKNVPIPLHSELPAGVLKTTEFLDNPMSGDEESVEALVAVHIGRLSLVDHSILVHPQYDGLHIFVEWKFLDFSQEDCETPTSLPLPRNRSFQSNFDYTKEYGLNKRRIALLRQWIELLNRLEFTLVTDGGEDGECDDLGVAQLDLREAAAQNSHKIEFLNVDGIPVAAIEIEVTYSKILLENFNV